MGRVQWVWFSRNWNSKHKNYTDSRNHSSNSACWVPGILLKIKRWRIVLRIALRRLSTQQIPGEKAKVFLTDHMGQLAMKPSLSLSAERAKRGQNMQLYGNEAYRKRKAPWNNSWFTTRGNMWSIQKKIKCSMLCFFLYLFPILSLLVSIKTHSSVWNELHLSYKSLQMKS